jgi:hypothetical protein
MLVMWRTAFTTVAEPVINIMCRDDQYNGRNKKEGFIIV